MTTKAESTLIINDDIIENEGTMNYKPRFLEKQVQLASIAFKAIIILGARQVGKSTLLHHLFPHTKMFVFDSILDPYNVKNDPDLFLDNQTIPLIFDEVQFVPALLSAIKRRVDLSSRPGQYYLTGSQNLNVLKTVAETMTGRAAILHLEGMSLHERAGLIGKESWLNRYLKAPESFINERIEIIPNLPSLTEVLWRGSLPQVLDLNREAVPLYLNSYIQTYVERDLRLVEKLEDLDRFGAFLGLLGALSGQEINYSQLGREINITPQTAKRWLFALSASYQWRDILPLYKNSIKQISEKRKGILTDTGIACHLLRIQSPEALALHPSLGATFEAWVANHIYQLMSPLSLRPQVYHWRMHGGAEIDLVLEVNGIYYPIEVKCSKNLNNYDLRSFKAFKENFSNSAPGLIIHAGDENYLLDRTTLALSWKAI